MSIIKISDLYTTVNEWSDSSLKRIFGGERPVIIKVPVGNSGITTVVSPAANHSTVIVVNLNKPTATTTIVPRD